MQARGRSTVSELRRGVAAVVAAAMAFTGVPAVVAQEVTTNGTTTGITVGSGFLFEPEVPFTSLKNVPTWSELEQLLDNPYAVTFDPTTPGNDQGFPSYRATGITRRPGFGVTLPSLLVHPLNYNPTTGEEMRLINRNFRKGRSTSRTSWSSSQGPIRLWVPTSGLAHPQRFPQGRVA